ncbi:metallophosphoesterase [Halovivax asiaticus JCM 14624]|uniref:Metallophosphoesterase n=1 Tax=Halovivax asiaticus JCM 14624 TaxID=1227490 RepID=M0BMP1_9EURY|nr:metallophosphoesterase [Halovivax asiaticus]ELZ12125.1 metallophosphoesterase [Halovivax asiaticus JCM 14624]
MTPAGGHPLSFAERAVYVQPAETLVLADVHLGRGATSAVDAPIDAADDPVGRLESLLDRFDPQTVVIAGDLLHSFSWIPDGVRETVAEIERVVTDAEASLVCTPGNHDSVLDEAFDGETAAAYQLDDEETVVCHGHERPPTEWVSDDGSPPSLYVIGHDHPALSIDGRKYPCFLSVPSAETTVSGDLLVLPAFSQLARGTTINTRRARDFQSPLVTGVGGASPAVRDVDGEETLWFPPLDECRHAL